MCATGQPLPPLTDPYIKEEEYDDIDNPVSCHSNTTSHTHASTPCQGQRLVHIGFHNINYCRIHVLNAISVLLGNGTDM